MRDADCVAFLQWALPRLGFRWSGYRKVHRTLCKRLNRHLRARGIADPTAYRRVLAQDPAEWTALDALCRIPISRFYRDRAVFDALRRDGLPAIARAALARDGRQIKAWSAGCASGEEAYSLRLAWDLDVCTRNPGVGLNILATDAEPALLARARAACYPGGALRDLPAGWRDRAFDAHDSTFCLRPRFRNGVTFQEQDIRSAQPAGPFDLVLCRNLAFTYFAAPLQLDVLRHIAGRLRAGGFLVIGVRERLPPDGAGFARCMGALPIYRRFAPAN